MANVFNKIADIKNNVKRNSFDWSHDNNFTTDLGRITPVFTELMPPNSSVRIKPEFGLRFMPMMFPIQTKMKAYLSFFKVPLRTLWSDYMDFISADNTEEYQPPFIKFSASDFKEFGCLTPSGLCDYFGIPVPSVVVPTEEGPALGFTGTFTPSSSFDNTGRYVFSVDNIPYPSADNTIIPRAILSNVTFVRPSFSGELTNPSGCVTGVRIENSQSGSDFVYVKIGDLKFSSAIEIPDNAHPLRCSFTISFMLS